MSRRLLVLALALMPTMASAGLYWSYTTTVTATTASSPVTFTDNGSGGTSVAFNAAEVSFYNSGSVVVYIDCKDTTATSADARLRPGQTLTIAYMKGDIVRGYGYSGCGILAASGTADVDVFAFRSEN